MNCDNITDLPLDFIISIIMLLPLIEAYRFCLLRKEWRNLWRQRTCLDFREINYCSTKIKEKWISIEKQENSKELKRLGKRKYVRFLNNTIKNFPGREISKLSFSLPYLMEYHVDIDDWIRIAVNKGVTELNLDFSDGVPLEPEPEQQDKQYVLPKFLYQNATFIRVLNVSSCRLGSANFASFVSLRSMSLTRVQIYWKVLTNTVLRCHLLESLSLVECSGLVKVYLTNNDRRLKKLVVKNCKSLSQGLELSLPRLEYFEYVGEPVEFNLSNLDALHEVRLDYKMDLSIAMVPSIPYMAAHVRQLFHGFGRTRILRVSTAFLKIATKLFRNINPMFLLMNFRHLQLTTSIERYEIPTILNFLTCLPFVNTLSVITTGLTRKTPLEKIMHRWAYRNVPEGIWTKTRDWGYYGLELVEIDGFSGSKNETDFLKLILKKASFVEIVILKPLVKGTPPSSAFLRAVEEIKTAALTYGNAEIKCL